jgi:hypothetical protein
MLRVLPLSRDPRVLHAAARIGVGTLTAATIAACITAPCLGGSTQSTGPVAYRQPSDTLFGCVAFTEFHLEDFEDGELDTPGLSASGGFVTSQAFPVARDSVDIDDGDLNCLSTNAAGTVQGDSWYTVVTTTFDFDSAALSGLPTHAGLVLTDATFAPAVVTAFDELGQAFASLVYDFPDPGDGSCVDDWFFGFFSASGISRLEVSVSDAIEVDHIQYGRSDLRSASDLDGDGLVNGADLGILLSNWGTPCLGEFTGDFQIDGADLGVLLANWSG